MKNAGPSEQRYGTPPYIVHAAERELGRRFALDAAAEAWSAKAARYFTVDDDGLAQPWVPWTWVNPPYNAQGEWIEKAVREWLDRGVPSVLLLKEASDASYWRQNVHAIGGWDHFQGRIAHIAPPEGVTLGKGRARRFYAGGSQVSGSDFPSALVWFGPGHQGRRERYRDARTGLLISSPDRMAA